MIFKVLSKPNQSMILYDYSQEEVKSLVLYWQWRGADLTPNLLLWLCAAGALLSRQELHKSKTPSLRAMAVSEETRTASCGKVSSNQCCQFTSELVNAKQEWDHTLSPSYRQISSSQLLLQQVTKELMIHHLISSSPTPSTFLLLWYTGLEPTAASG